MIKKIEETFEQRAAAADAAYTSAHLAVDAAKRKLRDRRAASAAAIMAVDELIRSEANPARPRRGSEPHPTRARQAPRRAGRD